MFRRGLVAVQFSITLSLQSTCLTSCSMAIGFVSHDWSQGICPGAAPGPCLCLAYRGKLASFGRMDPNGISARVRVGPCPSSRAGELASFDRSAWRVQVVTIVFLFSCVSVPACEYMPRQGRRRDGAGREDDDTWLLTTKPSVLVPILVYTSLFCFAITIQMHKFLVKHNSS